MIQSPGEPQSLLKDRAVNFHPSPEWIEAEVQSIRRRLLAHSPHVRSQDFSAIHTRDLQFLFEACDQAFFSGAASGLCVGSLVSFTFEGRRLTGRVNQITRRATVLVPGPNGTPYSDGQRYRKYYVPVAALTLAAYSPTTAKA